MKKCRPLKFSFFGVKRVKVGVHRCATSHRFFPVLTSTKCIIKKAEKTLYTLSDNNSRKSNQRPATLSMFSLL